MLPWIWTGKFRELEVGWKWYFAPISLALVMSDSISGCCLASNKLLKIYSEEFECASLC